MRIDTDGPVYEHDCTRCKYIATVRYSNETVFDCYWCDNDIDGGTVIARHSSDGPDYQSGSCFATSLYARNHLRLAYELGMYQGIIPMEHKMKLNREYPERITR